MPGPVLKAVLFDADGVFQRHPDDFFEQLAASLGISPADQNAFIAAVFDAEVPALSGLTDFATALRPVLEAWKISQKDFAAAWYRIDTDHSVLGLVAELRGNGIYCAIASNQERLRAEHMSQKLGYAAHFDCEFYSHALGHAKPSVEYFHAICRDARLDPATTLFLDDRIANVEGARQAGLTAEVFILDTIGEGGAAIRNVLRRYGLPP